MSVVQEICDKVAVLERGALVETGTVEELFRNPKTDESQKAGIQRKDPDPGNEGQTSGTCNVPGEIFLRAGDCKPGPYLPDTGQHSVC